MWSLLEPYEDSLKEAASRLDSWTIYLDFLLYGIPARSTQPPEVLVRTVYERGLVIHCLVPSLWVDYLKFLQTRYKVQSWSESASSRALRNCPWSGDVWSESLLIREASKGFDDVEEWCDSLKSCMNHPGIQETTEQERGKVLVTYASSLCRWANAAWRAQDQGKANAASLIILERVIPYISTLSVELSLFYRSCSLIIRGLVCNGRGVLLGQGDLSVSLTHMPSSSPFPLL